MLNRMEVASALPSEHGEASEQQHGSIAAAPCQSGTTIDPRHLASSTPLALAAETLSNPSAMPINASQAQQLNGTSNNLSSARNNGLPSLLPPSSNALAPSSNATSSDAWYAPRHKNGLYPYSRLEDDLLLRCFAKYGTEGWSRVSAAFIEFSKGPPRSAGAVESHCRKLIADEASAASANTTNRSSVSTTNSSPTLLTDAQDTTTTSSSTFRSNMQSVPTPSTGPSNGGRQLHKPVLSGAPAASSSTSGAPVSIFGQAAPSAAAIANIPPPPNGRRWPSWPASEDSLLLQCVQKHGTKWRRVQLAFAEGGGSSRGHRMLRSRYEKLCEAAEREQRAAGSQASSTHQTGSIALARAKASEPSPPQVSASSSGWTQEEEAHLLAVALQHKDVDNLLDQVEAVWDGWRAVYLDTTRSLESLHTKYSQLLQLHAAQQAQGSEGRGSGGTEAAEEHVDDEEGEEDSILVDEEATSTAPQGASTTSGQQHSGHTTHAPSACTSSEVLHHTSPQEALLDASSGPSSAPPALSAMPTQGTTAPPLRATALDLDIQQLEYGLRIECCPRDSELSILTPIHYKLKSPATGKVEPGSPAEGAAFVFNIMSDGSIVQLVAPPNTKTHVVLVGANAEQVGLGAKSGEAVVPVGVETRVIAEDGYKIVFYSPLGW